jgi:D-alanine-D-alanine ligase
MATQRKIAILTGGESSEREIGIASAKNVFVALKDRYELSLFDFPEDIKNFLNTYQEFDLVVPVFHGPGGEDGVIQGFLKTLGLKFIFSEVEAHAIGMDKSISKFLAESAGLLTAPYRVLYKKEKINYEKPLVVKPMAGGSSIGIQIVNDQKTLDQAIANAFEYSDKVLIEDYISGDEFTVPVVYKDGFSLALPVIQIKSKNKFFDYESKYDAALVEEICPAKISEDLANKLKSQALKIHELIGARHISRSDFIVSADSIYFLEINTIPGMTDNSLLPKAIKAQGLDFSFLLSSWIEEQINKD